MDEDARRRVVRAARVLLRWDQERFAAALGVGTATLKRYEAGYSVAKLTEAWVFTRLPELGVVVIEGAIVGPRRVSVGVALVSTAVIGDAPPMRTDAAPSVRKKGVRAEAKPPRLADGE